VSDVGVVDSGVIAVPRDEFCKTEIENFCLTAVGEKNVGGLDVAMNDTFFVSGVERVGELNAESSVRFSGSGPVRMTWSRALPSSSSIAMKVFPSCSSMA